MGLSNFLQFGLLSAVGFASNLSHFVQWQPHCSRQPRKHVGSSLPRQKIYRVPLSMELQRDDFFPDTRKKRWHSVLESHAGGRSMSTELEREKKKKLPRSARIIRSPSFESDKRALVMKFRFTRWTFDQMEI